MDEFQFSGKFRIKSLSKKQKPTGMSALSVQVYERKPTVGEKELKLHRWKLYESWSSTSLLPGTMPPDTRYSAEAFFSRIRMQEMNNKDFRFFIAPVLSEVSYVKSVVNRTGGKILSLPTSGFLFASPVISLFLEEYLMGMEPLLPLIFNFVLVPPWGDFSKWFIVPNSILQ